ncbi:MAG: M23 family metallopeptidase [Peptococcaceae bacterium]
MTRKPRKQKKNFTIMVVPHANTAVKSLKIPMWLINGLAVFGLASLVVVTYLTFSYMNFQITLSENKELKTVNTTQAKEIQELQLTTRKTLSKLEEIVATDAQVRALVGLKEPEEVESKNSSRGNGGPGTDGRTIQTLTATEFDLIQSISSKYTEEYEDNHTSYDTYELDEKPNLATLSKIKSDINRINVIIDDQKQVLAKLQIDVKDRLDYLAAVPNEWPVKGRITSDFGWRRNPFTNRTWEFHEGLDIAASYGTPVKAAGEGKVTFIGWKPAYGNTVVIKHGYGYTSQYGHNSRISVKVGQVVRRGDVIARVGSTGRSTGPHVDFRIAYNGRWIDPLKLLNK